MNKLANHAALKEWAEVIDALRRGEQINLLRKGGIADPAFGVEAERFYLYPTWFHKGEAEPRSKVEIACWAEVARTWRLSDATLLELIAPLVALPRATVEARYRFRAEQALYVIALRVFELPSPVGVAFNEAYAGCRSWISLDDEIAIDGSRQVLSDSDLADRVASIDAMLAPAGAAASR